MKEISQEIVAQVEKMIRLKMAKNGHKKMIENHSKAEVQSWRVKGGQARGNAMRLESLKRKKAQSSGHIAK